VGRGTASGHGKTATRGQKGQRARTSINLPKNFEGGQTKLAMRTPKLRGFHNRWRRTFAVINLTRLNRFQDGAEVTPEALLDAGAIKDVEAGIKVLGTGALKRRLSVHAHRFSRGARQKIEAAGGTATIISLPGASRTAGRPVKGEPGGTTPPTRQPPAPKARHQKVSTPPRKEKR
jgi:large subunit ribosomal protein L15